MLIPTRFLEKIRIYIRLTRWHNQLTFLPFVLGYFLAKDFKVSPEGFLLLILAFFALSILLYGGIYALNDLKDAKLDEENPFKKDRPIPSGKIGKEAVLVIIAVHLLGGLGVSYLIGMRVFYMALIFFVVNFFYSFAARNLPYLDIMVNAATHALRFLFGLWLAGDFRHILLVAIYYVVALISLVYRRHHERTVLEGNYSARPVLKYYSPAAAKALMGTLLVVLVVLVFSARGIDFILGLALLIFSLASFIAYYYDSRTRNFIEQLYASDIFRLTGRLLSKRRFK